VGVIIAEVIGVVIMGGESHIGFAEVPDCEGVPISDHHPHANIEFTVLHDQRILNIFLSDELELFLLAHLHYFHQVSQENDASPTG
jgi:hypothetical protein